MEEKRDDKLIFQQSGHLQAMLESLTKSNADRTDKEKRISNNCEEAKTSLQYKLNPEKQGQKSDVTKEDQKLNIKNINQAKTKDVCAINEKELNKVELAYFKRPLPPHTVILSDKYVLIMLSNYHCRDANRQHKDSSQAPQGKDSKPLNVLLPLGPSMFGGDALQISGDLAESVPENN